LKSTLATERGGLIGLHIVLGGLNVALGRAAVPLGLRVALTHWGERSYCAACPACFLYPEFSMLTATPTSFASSVVFSG